MLNVYNLVQLNRWADTNTGTQPVEQLLGVIFGHRALQCPEQSQQPVPTETRVRWGWGCSSPASSQPSQTASQSNSSAERRTRIYFRHVVLKSGEPRCFQVQAVLASIDIRCFMHLVSCLTGKERCHCVAKLSPSGSCKSVESSESKESGSLLQHSMRG